MKTYTLPQMNVLERDMIKKLHSPLNLAQWNVFLNGTIFVRVKPARQPVVVLGRITPPADNFFMTLLLLDTLRRAEALKISLILPYFAYGRQDAAHQRGEAVGAQTATRLLAAAGASRIITLDVHSRIVQTGSPVPLVSVDLFSEMAAKLRISLRKIPCTIVSPDEGGKHRARKFALALGAGSAVAWFEKKRGDGLRIIKPHGKFLGTTAVLVDDIIDTGTTIQKAVLSLRKKGFTTFYLCVTHPVFSKNARQIIRSLRFKKIIVSDTLALTGDTKTIPGLLQVHCRDILAAYAA